MEHASGRKLASDSTLRSPHLTPCIMFSQRLWHQPLHCQCPPPASRASGALSCLVPPPPGGRAPGKSSGPEPGAGHPAALPTGQSRRGGGGADGRQGLCLSQVESKGGQGSLPTSLTTPGRGLLSSLHPPQALQVELSRAREAQRRRQQHTAAAEEQLKLVANSVSRYGVEGGWSSISASPAPWAPWSLRAQARGAGKLAVGGCRSRGI